MNRDGDNPNVAPHLAPDVAPERRMVGEVIIQLPTEVDFAQLDDIRLFAGGRTDRTKVRRIWTRVDAPADPLTAEERAYLLLRYLQGQPFFAGQMVPASDLNLCTARSAVRYACAKNLGNRSLPS
jgi:hypothetical protein